MERVLVVDDEPQVLIALQDQLSDDFVVLTAGSAEQALSLVERESDLAVVVTDQRMPELTGDQLLARLDGKTDAIRVLLTGFADIEAVARAVNEGKVFAYVPKPWSASDLRLKVQRAAEHFRLARELDMERRLLRDLMDSIPDGIYFKDSDLRFLRANPAYLARIGLSAEWVRGKKAREIGGFADSEALEREERALLDGAGPQLDVVRLERRDGGEVWLSESKAPVKGPDGAVLGVVGISRDITLRKSSEARLLRLTSVRALISGINAAIVRAKRSDELLEQSCKIAATTSEVSLAVAARIVAGSDKVQIIACEPHGHPVIAALEQRLVEGRHESPLLQQLVSVPRPMVVNDIAASTQLRYADLMLAHQLRSVAVIPLMSAGQIDAVFCLFSERIDFFDHEEMELLCGVADNISYALEHIGKTERLNFLAYYDELTRLPNRDLLLELAEQQITAHRREGKRFALMVIDIDRFRQVNDTLGRGVGDALLARVAVRCRELIGDKGTVARVFGDTFAVLMPEFESEASLGSLVENELPEALGGAWAIEGVEVPLSTRVGVAMFPADGGSAAVLLSNAETAAKKAKLTGQSYAFYAPSMNAKVAEKLDLETKLRRAIQRDEFLLHYQPKTDLRTGCVVGLEALIRWRGADGVLVPPGRFIPLLEETGLIREVGRWVLVRAARQHQEWSREGAKPPRIAVNVSAIQLASPDFSSSLEGLLAQALELEITESVFVDDLAGSTSKLEQARQRGFSIAMDDFGTGYSSLSALERLPLDALKIDQSFVRRMMDNAQSTSIVTTIISLAHALDLKVIAEGVETLEQARLLRLLKCNQAQGYLMARPVPPEEIPSLLTKEFKLDRGPSGGGWT
jgi:diguanylate cyclase (GGDEF)-like protein/PAS domain S-box-containing protein